MILASGAVRGLVNAPSADAAKVQEILAMQCEDEDCGTVFLVSHFVFQAPMILQRC